MSLFRMTPNQVPEVRHTQDREHSKRTVRYHGAVIQTCPHSVTFDQPVLCFEAHFQEAVYEKKVEQFRVKHWKRNDSIQAAEIRQRTLAYHKGCLMQVNRADNSTGYLTVKLTFCVTN